ncbi:peptidoglycan DD-metalloendopeptidase family protein [Romboutsia sedimentorum]|uniref:Peptidoglycan DD-metalloendopeptidase family protein n=1 Tax=Romboutsia sedimentorum TaxID=1368474 RepID=A0ABT7E9I6_9FIRM|nr:peptidoglycan DD-metalloendopeptidase family protein [Romboutsia sedimentorum]MDK2562748.1 peptidoglycan DD-metalloendopeptidase family protein [Romboutsia sedimentorum]
MKKTISIITTCAVLISTNFIYADEKQENLDKKLIENRSEQTTLEEKIKALDSNVSDIEKNIDASNGEIEKLGLEIDKTKSEIETLENNIKKNEEALGKRLKAINNTYSMEYINVILSSDSLSDFFNNIYIVKQVVEQDKKILKELDKNKAEVQKKEKDFNDKKDTQEKFKVTLEQNKEKVKADKSELEALKRELETEEDSLENEVEKLAAESAAKQAQLNAANNTDDSLNGAIISSGSWPVPGHSTISSPYGYRLHPVLNIQKMHTGIDIPASTGTPAVAIDSGTVTYSAVQGTYGNTVMIQHDDGKVSLYAHNSQLLVSVGQRVQKGQVVSKIGTTGRSTGPHLHFEIRINGKHTNPVPYI